MQPIHDFELYTRNYPDIKLSYETVSHKKVSVKAVAGNAVAGNAVAGNAVAGNAICAVAIPHGKKYVLWTTTKTGTNIGMAYLIELGKNHQNNTVLLRGYIISTTAPIPLKHKYGMILYGTLFQREAHRPVFIADDIYMFEGQVLHDIPWGYRIPFLVNVMRDWSTLLTNKEMDLAVAVMWNPDADFPIGYSDSDAKYHVRHIQYRETRRIAPYVNVLMNTNHPLNTCAEDTSESTRHVLAKMMPPPMVPRFNYQNNQFRLNTVFLVSADVQYDVYNLFALGKAGAKVFVGLAGIQHYKTSVFMNRIFRKIRENENLDSIEESDDESDFENMDETKYVDLEKCVAIECAFQPKIKKWVPQRLVSKDRRIVHISALTMTSDHGYPPDDKMPKRPDLKFRSNR